MRRIIKCSGLLYCFICSNLYAANIYIQAQGGWGGINSSNYPGTSLTNQYQSISKQKGQAWRLSIGYMPFYDSTSTSSYK